MTVYLIIGELFVVLLLVSHPEKFKQALPPGHGPLPAYLGTAIFVGLWPFWLVVTVGMTVIYLVRR